MVRNEERFVSYAIRSVIDMVEKVIVFDTGSTDNTIAVVQSLQQEYPDKILFEQKGECDKMQHTRLRQEMIERTTTDWFLILDGDEVWTERGIRELKQSIQGNPTYGCIFAPYYLCVGDIYHHSLRGFYHFPAVQLRAHISPKIFRRENGIHWNNGAYGEGDFIADNEGAVIRPGYVTSLKEKFWHTSALIRSSEDAVVTLGRHKQVLTYSLWFMKEGYAISGLVPEVFRAYPSVATQPLSRWHSLINLVALIAFKLKLSQRRYWVAT